MLSKVKLPDNLPEMDIQASANQQLFLKSLGAAAPVVFLLILLFQAEMTAFADDLLSGTVSKDSSRPDSIQFLGNPKYLRIAAQDDLDRADFDSAIEKIKEALAIEPASVANHIIYARALTDKYMKEQRGNIDLYQRAVDEWGLVKSRDRDTFEHDEALQQLMSLKASRLLSRAPRRSKAVNAKLMLSDH